MRTLRLIHLSLFHFLRNNIYRDVINEPVVVDDNFKCKANFDSLLPSKPVFVLPQHSIVPISGCVINYVTGEILLPEDSVEDDTVRLTYSYNWVDIRYAWPDELFDTPVAAIYPGASTETGFELGSSTKEIFTRFYIDVFALDEFQRDDIAQEVREAFDNRVPLIDYNKGFPIKANGTKDEEFSSDSLEIGSIEIDENIRITPNPTRDNFSPEERVRALIEIDTTTYRA